MTPASLRSKDRKSPPPPPPPPEGRGVRVPADLLEQLMAAAARAGPLPSSQTHEASRLALERGQGQGQGQGWGFPERRLFGVGFTICCRKGGFTGCVEDHQHVGQARVKGHWFCHHAPPMTTMSSDVSGSHEHGCGSSSPSEAPPWSSSLTKEKKMKRSRDINWVAVKTVVQGVACMCEPFQLITPPSERLFN